MLGTWKVNGGVETRQFSQYASTVQQSRSIRRSNIRWACYPCRRKKVRVSVDDFEADLGQLKCSGDLSGCDRCRSLGNRCKYPHSVEEGGPQDETKEFGDAPAGPSEDASFDELAFPPTTLAEFSDVQLHDSESALAPDTQLSRARDAIHAKETSPEGKEKQIATECIDTTYMLHASIHPSNALHDIALAESAPQGIHESPAISLAGFFPHTTPSLDTENDFTPWSDPSWCPDSSYDEASESLGAQTAEHSAHLSDAHYALHDTTFDVCECLRTAAQVLHELSTHASLAGAPSKSNLDRHLEMFDYSTRRLRGISRCTTCRTRSENMMINAMALQQLCTLCEQMTKAAESDSCNNTWSIDIRIGQFQVPVGNERAKIYATVVLSQLHVMVSLVKDFRMAAAGMPIPFALLQSIESKIQRLCNIHHR